MKEKRFLIRHIAVLILSVLSFSVLFGSQLEYPLFDYVNKSDLIIQGKINHINNYSGHITANNIDSIKDTAYIQVNKIYKNSSTDKQIKTDIKLIMPTSNRTTENGMIKTKSTDIFYQTGQNGIWLLKGKDGVYNANHYQAFQPNSKDELIEQLCKIKPQNLHFLDCLFWSKYDEGNQILIRHEIDPDDSIFFYKETNPIFIAAKRRNADFIQELIDYGFDIKFKDSNNENVLFVALTSFDEDTKIIEILLSNGVETEITNTNGITINDLINRSKNKKEIIELFQKYGE